MTRYKVFSILLLVAMLSALPLGMVSAQETGTLVTGTIQSLTLETDPVTGISTVLVFMEDEAGQTLKARVSLETALTKLLVIPNALVIDTDLVIPDPVNPALVLASGKVTALAFVTDLATPTTSLSVTLLVPPPPDAPLETLPVELVVTLGLEQAISLDLIVTDAALVGTVITLESTEVLETETYSDKVTKLVDYFGATLGLTADQLAAYEDEFGFGVIAEACWMAASLGGTVTVDQILVAKGSSDFSTIILPDGTSPTNWGQLRKAVLVEKHQNPGRIVSGKALPLTPPAPEEPAPTDEAPVVTTTEQTHGNDKNQDKDHGKGHSKNDK